MSSSEHRFVKFMVKFREKTECRNCPHFVNFNREPVTFSLKFMDQGKYGVSSCEHEDMEAFLRTMHKLSQLTWEKVISTNRHKLGCEYIEQKSIHASMPSCITPDIRLMAFRFSGMKPMVGFRIRDTFYVVWLDRDFSLYKH